MDTSPKLKPRGDDESRQNFLSSHSSELQNNGNGLSGVVISNPQKRKRQHDEEYEDLPVIFEDICMAGFRIKGGITNTQCLFSEQLSKDVGCSVYFKHDHRQFTGSFKERGALNALLKLSMSQRNIGVIAASAGNHALALSYHGKRLGIPVTVVMPTTAPLTKVKNCELHNATVHLHGTNIAQAKSFALKIATEKSLAYINGYDDPDIIAGAGTLGVEIVEQVPDLEYVLVPVGGAGLIAGVSVAIKRLKPEVKIIGVEPLNCPSFSAALSAGKPVETECRPTLADGLAVPTVGENAFEIARKYVDKVVKVPERYVALAVLRLVEKEKIVVEGGGGIGLAALLADMLPEVKGKKVVVALCGGNIDITTLGKVIERGLAADGRLIRLEAWISDRPGGLATFTRIIAEEGASVKDIFHDRAFLDKDIATVNVRLSVETRDTFHGLALIQRLQREDIQFKLDPITCNVLGLKEDGKPKGS